MWSNRVSGLFLPFVTVICISHIIISHFGALMRCDIFLFLVAGAGDTLEKIICAEKEMKTDAVQRRWPVF